MNNKTSQSLSQTRMVYGFHAVGVHLKTAPQAVQEIWFDPSRRDARMRQFLQRLQEAEITPIEADSARLSRLVGSFNHQGVVARVTAAP